MAPTNGYTTAAVVKARMGISDTDSDSAIDDAITAASRMIDGHCGRRFYVDGQASARKFSSVGYDRYGRSYVDIDDASALTSVKTDSADSGTFDITWTTSEYEAHPVNGVVSGVEGWPVTRLVAVESRTFPVGRRSRVQVNATWGWAAVPQAVNDACRILSQRLFRRKDTPEGFAAGGDFEPVRLGRTDPDVAVLLELFVIPTQARRW